MITFSMFKMTLGNLNNYLLMKEKAPFQQQDNIVLEKVFLQDFNNKFKTFQIKIPKLEKQKLNNKIKSSKLNQDQSEDLKLKNKFNNNSNKKLNKQDLLNLISSL